MKRAKKALAILLSAMMLTTLIPMSAFAAETNETVEAPDEYVEIPDESDSFEGEEIIEESSPGETADEIIEEIPDEIETESEIAVEDGSDVAVEDSSDAMVEEAVEEGAEEAEEITELPDGSEDAFVPEDAQENGGEAVGLEAASSEKKDYKAPAEISFEDAEDIALDEWKTVNLVDEGSYEVFRFSPEENGYYVFCSQGDYDQDAYGQVFDSDGVQLAEDDDSNGNHHFNIPLDMEAGKTYYLVADKFSSGSSISYNVTVIKYAEVTVSFDANGGYFDMMDEPNTLYEATVSVAHYIDGSTPSQPIREGFAFKGWSETSEGEVIDPSSYAATESITLYAIWTNPITITFDANGGYFSWNLETTDKRECPEGESVGDWSPNEPVRDDGYVFSGWSETSDGETVDLSDYTATEPKTFYAIWEQLVIITFDANGGYFDWNSETTLEQQYVEGENLGDWTVSNPVRDDGYVFKGWSETSDGEPVSLLDYTATEPKTFYAIWGKAVVITYDANGGKFPWSSETIYEREYGEGESVGNWSPSDPEFDGHVFRGWSETPEGETVNLNNYTATEPKTFYAIWKNAVAITFDANGGTFDWSSEATYEHEYAEGDSVGNWYPSDPVRDDGYVFKGWSETPEGETVNLYNYTATEPKTFYAVWGNAVIITFDANGGIFESNSDTTYERKYAEGDSVDRWYQEEPVRDDDYAFKGWSETPDGETVNLWEYTATEPKTFYAVWGKAVVITFDANGGIFKQNSEITYKQEYAEGDSLGKWYIDKPVRDDGYAFKGWSETPDGETVNLWDYIATEPKTFYAIWGKAVVITFEANGGEYDWISDTSYERTYAEGEAVMNQYPSEPTRENFVFKGWSDSPEGDTIDLYDYYATEDMTFYAVWAESVEITFDPNNGTFSEEYDNPYKLKVGKNDRLSNYGYPLPTREGYVHKGWAKTTDASEPLDLYDVKATGPMTLYAVWKPAVTVTYMGNGGVYGDEETFTVNCVEGDYIDNYEIPSFEQEGKIHTGFSLTKDGEAMDEGDLYSLTAYEGMILYAVWEDSVTITFDGNGGTYRTKPTLEKSYAKGDFINDKIVGRRFTRSGYSIIGWALTPTGAAIDNQYLSNTKAEKDIIYYAVWVKDIVITFDGNGGEVEYYDDEEDDYLLAPTFTKNYTYGKYVYPPDARRDGYYLDGWAASKDGPTIEAFWDNEVCAEKDATYYAIWEKYLTVNFLANDPQAKLEDGEGKAADTYKYEWVYKNDCFSDYAPSILTAPADKVLKGWALTPDATEVLPLDFEVTEDNMTFYAIWEDAVKVTFDANGGVFEDGQPVNVIDYKSGDLLGKRARVPVNSKEGVHLFGWATTKDAKEANVDLEKDRVTGPATYYAVWLDSVNARFHLDPDDPDWVRNAVQVKGSKMTGSAFYQAPGDMDHTFDYWSLEKFGGTRVNLADYVINEDTDFYANFKEVRTVILDAENGYFATEDEWRFTCQGEPGKPLSITPSDIPTCYEKGYHFTGWYDWEGDFVTDDLPNYIPEESTWLYAHYEKDAENIPVSSVTVTPEATTLTEKGATLRLSAAILPENATNKGMNWTSSDPNVATVNGSGLVTAVEDGTAVITATAKDGSGVFGTASVTVKIPTYDLKVENGTLTEGGGTSGSFREGAKVSVTANTPPEGKLFDKWTVAPETVPFEDDTQNSSTAIITMPAGSVTVSAVFKDKPVEHISVASVTVTPASATLDQLGKTVELSAAVLPENASDKTVTWSSSAPGVATVDTSGKVTAVAEGTATITATANDGSGKSGSAVITVKLPRYVLTITGGTLKGSTNTQGEFLKDQVVEIVANTPDTGKRFAKWTMEGDAQYILGTETSEAITIRMPAAAVSLTATYEDVKVYVDSVTVQGDKTKLTAAGETTQLTAVVLPDNATNRELIWSSSNLAAATVDQNGKVTAVANGDTLITALAKDGSGRKGTIAISVAIPEVVPDDPTVTPTVTPTVKPTVTPTKTPTVKPTATPTKAPAKPTPTAKPTPVPVKAADGTAVGAGASAKAAADAIKKASSDEGPSGTKFSLLQARLKKATKSSIAIRWNAVKGATQYVIYGNACGKGKGFEELGRVSGKTFTCSKLADGTKLKKNKYYKFMVMAVKGSGASETVVATSKTLHITTLGGKYNNFKSIKVTKKPSKSGLKLKKTFKIKATATKKGKKAKAHRKLAYESDNEKVVTVSKSGKITAVGKGTANIYIYASDGTFKKIKVKVK